ncbi:alcohol dehydrogenase catalytic domain-containing protein [Streptacidiphilus sp. EB103A]|uniref:alcohol dehydrogenase catalytic domain-containing protein n=1 Tax=Streptacidiphilus sp. EB103A TaxID=3156275 RepID=UPI0035188014
MNRQARAVRFDRYGDHDVLYVNEVPMPDPGPGEVVVEVRAAAINPFDTVIRSGVVRELFPATFPSGRGSDLAGVVVAAGAGVEWPVMGDEVLGWTPGPSAQATHATVPVAQLVAKPSRLSWEAAGSLHMVGSMAYAALRAPTRRDRRRVRRRRRGRHLPGADARSPGRGLSSEWWEVD